MHGDAVLTDEGRGRRVRSIVWLMTRAHCWLDCLFDWHLCVHPDSGVG